MARKGTIVISSLAANDMCIYLILVRFLSLFQGMLNEKSDKFPIFRNMRTLELDSCFLEDYELYEKLEALGSFLQSAPCLEKLILKYCMVHAVLCIASCFR
jgi:hypothetical protein